MLLWLLPVITTVVARVPGLFRFRPGDVWLRVLP